MPESVPQQLALLGHCIALQTLFSRGGKGLADGFLFVFFLKLLFPLLRRYRNAVGLIAELRGCLVSFPRALVPDVQKRQHLAQRARNAFLIKTGDTYSEQVERYLKLIKEEAIAAIKSRPSAVRDANERHNPKWDPIPIRRRGGAACGSRNRPATGLLFYSFARSRATL